uniref:alpha-ketoglutarate-dependent dioxygenase alkB homolog 4-like n=1 Tax=Styela clava TaxID=7725 RepID=UPI001939DE23|nr:alpha-ketoglutarate-dependent dioxygenase alkB homolog 4-like [Styela clava]
MLYTELRRYHANYRNSKMEENKNEECACVGIRTCLKCEMNHKSETLSQNQRECKHYYYNHATKSAELTTITQNEINELPHFFEFPGVIVINDFISHSEEIALVNAIDGEIWKLSQSGRRKQDFGPKVNFKKQKCKIASFSGLPSYCKFAVDRLSSINGLNDFKTVELCNLEYSPERGSAIDPHFDDSWLWGERLVTLNLLSDSWLTMTWGGSSINWKNLPCIGMIDPTDIKVKIPLRARSLVVLHGPARHSWKHGILREDIKNRRVCCTFRELSFEFLNGNQRNQGCNLLKIANTFSGNVVI